MKINSNLKRFIKNILENKKIKLIKLFVSSFFNYERTLDLLNESDRILKINIKNPTKKTWSIYYVIGSHNYGGFFAQFNDVLQYLYFSDFHGFKPIIVYRDSFYFSKDYSTRVGTNNTFEYYFKQPYISESSFFNSEVHNKYINSIESHKNFLKEQLNKNKHEIEINRDSLVTVLSKMYQKYISLNESIMRLINNDISELIDFDEKYVAVHFRGSDFRKELHMHPKFIPPKEYFIQIDSFMKRHKVDKIFLATDDQIALQQFIQKYGSKLYFFDGTHRSNDSSNPYYKSKSRQYNNFLNGYEVLRDVITLSRADFFICGKSNVSTTTQIINLAIEKKFTDIYIFESSPSKKRTFLEGDEVFKSFINNRDVNA